MKDSKTILEIKREKGRLVVYGASTPMDMIDAGLMLLRVACDKIGENTLKRPSHKEFVELLAKNMND